MSRTSSSAVGPVAGEASGRLGAVMRRVAASTGLTPALARDALLIFVASRIGFIVLTLVLLPTQHAASGGAAFLDAWGRLDALRYAAIADHGYTTGAHADNAAFFPLMPLLMRLVSPLAGGNSIVAGLIVANAAYLAALLGLAALAAHEYDTATARRAMVYLTLFPAALFCFAGYTESLFLALSIWCLVAIRRHQWWQAGALSMLAAATRQVGVFLVVPMLYEHLALARWQLRRLRPTVLWALLAPVGPLLFAWWLGRTVGDPLAFAHAQRFWYRQFAFPWNTFHRVLVELPKQTPLVLLVRGVIDLAAVLLFAGLIVLGARRWRAGDTIYASALWVLAICYPSLYWPLLSDTRFMLAEVPCFVLLAALGRRRWVNIVVPVVFAALLLVMTYYFFTTQQIL
ncbi:MAG TPA: mannosyltransferase family protein [Ktedonobacterales bacterium]|nr:mannosyltransferase family protein [Ktedonobacterales bacterium]